MTEAEAMEAISIGYKRVLPPEEESSELGLASSSSSLILMSFLSSIPPPAALLEKGSTFNDFPKLAKNLRIQSFGFSSDPRFETLISLNSPVKLFPWRSSTSNFSNPQISLGIWPPRSWKGRDKTLISERSPTTGEISPPSLLEQEDESGKWRRLPWPRSSSSSQPLRIKETTLESELQETPNQEQWFELSEFQLERTPFGSEKLLFNSRRTASSSWEPLSEKSFREDENANRLSSKNRASMTFFIFSTETEKENQKP